MIASDSSRRKSGFFLCVCVCACHPGRKEESLVACRSTLLKSPDRASIFVRRGRGGGRGERREEKINP